MKYHSYLLLIFFLLGCENNDEDIYRYSKIISQSKEYSVYLDMIEIGNIHVTARLPQGAPFKILYNDKYYFVGDMLNGIYVYEKNAGSASYLCFIECKYIKDFELADDRLFCNNFVDLVVLDVSNPLQINILHRQKNHFNRFTSYKEYWNVPYLAYRDLPKIILSHVAGKKAIDFGCGTGRSTRFLKKLGFDVTGIDISKDMLGIAQHLDTYGDYQIVSNGQYSQLGVNKYDLIQSIFTFDNIPGWENRTNILTGLRDLLKKTGKIICLDSAPELYTHEWASFSTKDFPENWKAKTGDIVRDIMLDVEDRRPVEDIFWTVEDYHVLFEKARLVLDATYKPLGNKDEPHNWISEINTAPWIIFVLSKM